MKTIHILYCVDLNNKSHEKVGEKISDTKSNNKIYMGGGYNIKAFFIYRNAFTKTTKVKGI